MNTGGEIVVLRDLKRIGVQEGKEKVKRGGGPSLRYILGGH